MENFTAEDARRLYTPDTRITCLLSCAKEQAKTKRFLIVYKELTPEIKKSLEDRLFSVKSLSPNTYKITW